MKNSTKNKMHKYALTLPPCSARAQCLRIAGLILDNNETISERIQRDHTSIAHAKRASRLVVDAGAAIETGAGTWFYGDIVFEDGSII
jgi:hypothetical protein